MFQLSLTICCCYIVVLIIIVSLPCRTISQDYLALCLGRFQCGNDLKLFYPFWLSGFFNISSTAHCGYPGFSVSCSKSNGKPVLNISNDLYYIQEFHKQSLLILNLDFHEKTCPRPHRNFTVDHAFTPLFVDKRSTMNFTYFFNCTSKPPLPVLKMGGSFYDSFFHLKCLDYNDRLRTYVFRNDFINPKILEWSWKNCEENIVVPAISNSSNIEGIGSYTLQRGFMVTWHTQIGCESCESSGGLCIYDDEMKRSSNCTYCPPDEGKLRFDQSSGFQCALNSLNFLNSGDQQQQLLTQQQQPQQQQHKKIVIGASIGVGGLTVVIFLLFVYLQYQKKRRGPTAPNVDLFLENYGCLSLQRYRYKDIKKMTNSFKDKLGQGGYGSVFKGKLTDGRLVAVKVLANNPQKSTNGEEFINEVATIGTTNHVNIVALLGFCSSGSKRALVYEFMPNGSLEKFIHAKKEKSSTTTTTTDSTTTYTSTTTTTLHLGWETLYQISLGIARGLEYLHRGCNTGRILHFDIKPHNILLDENFCPKVSDFGLAKLCPTRESIVSMLTGGRGTVGYIAPEVYCRNFGGVSYKSDVYSYGMMVLEMVGGRKNIDPFVDNTSEIYFPHWVHDRLQEQNDKNIEDLLRFEGAIEEQMAKKMIMVGLWCIQTNPAHRPSMGRVAEMLEGQIGDLRMPPKPIVDLSSPPPPTAL